MLLEKRKKTKGYGEEKREKKVERGDQGLGLAIQKKKEGNESCGKQESGLGIRRGRARLVAGKGNGKKGVEKETGILRNELGKKKEKKKKGRDRTDQSQ